MYFNNILRAHFNFDSPKMNEWMNIFHGLPTTPSWGPKFEHHYTGPLYSH